MRKMISQNKFEKNLCYIIPEASENKIEKSCELSIVIVFYLYYEDTLYHYTKYILGVPDNVDILIISSKNTVLEQLKKICSPIREDITYLLKENRGRDISALLVTSQKSILNHDLFCFVHDKKSHNTYLDDDVSLWIRNLWDNTVRDAFYIHSVIDIFYKNKNIGMLCTPEYIGKNHMFWVGKTWTMESLEATKSLAEKLNIQTEIVEYDPPLSVGTCFWARTDAVKKIFEYHWNYTDFDDEKLSSQNYLSYGVERIFPYLSEEAGFDVGEIMDIKYAEIQSNFYRYAVPNYFFYEADSFPCVLFEDKIKLRGRMSELFENIKPEKELYIYGKGNMGKYILKRFIERDIYVKGFIETKTVEHQKSSIPVYSIDSFRQNADMTNAFVIISAYDQEIQEQMKNQLIHINFFDYYTFWND